MSTHAPCVGLQPSDLPRYMPQELDLGGKAFSVAQMTSALGMGMNEKPDEYQMADNRDSTGKDMNVWCCSQDASTAP